MQVDREVGVDEQEAVERQRRADAVAEVRGRRQARQRGQRLARQERVAQAHPHPPRARAHAALKASASPWPWRRSSPRSEPSSANRTGLPDSGGAAARSCPGSTPAPVATRSPAGPRGPPGRAARSRGRRDPPRPAARPPAPARGARRARSAWTWSAEPSGSGAGTRSPVARSGAQRRAPCARTRTSAAPPARRRAGRADPTVRARARLAMNCSPSAMKTLSVIASSNGQCGDEVGQLAGVAQRRSVAEADERRLERREPARRRAVARRVGRERVRGLMQARGRPSSGSCWSARRPVSARGRTHARTTRARASDREYQAR